RESSEPLLCRLSRGGTIEGLVTDEAGRPVMGLPVVVNSILCRTDAVTDPNGRFFADHLPDTRYSVIVEPESESPYATTVLNGGASCNARDLRIVVKRKTEEKTVTSLIGTSIWQLDGVPMSLEQSKCQGRAILLCLFDGNQRPSRNCVQQLGEKAENLAARKVVVASIDASKADPAGREGRTHGNGIVAASHAQSLPWLILTDEKHVVRAEGFTLDELEERVEQMRGE
ncbi:MAG: carboxypeptidase-like regulatory domain-containing protein, partial [Phycisphaerales bacterium]